MTNFHVCLVCSNPSQTDIDGKANGKRKMKGSDAVQSQLRSVFLLQKLLKVSTTTCVELLKINDGSNPSSWFSCCWTCFTIITEAEKVFSELNKLEKQLTNLKTAFQTKFQTSWYIKLEKPESVSLEEKKIEITVNRIRDEAFKKNSLLNGFAISEDTEEEQFLDDIKIEVNEDSVDAELVTHSSNSSNDEPTIVVPTAVVKGKTKGIRKLTLDIPKRTRSGRLVKPRIQTYEAAPITSSDEENDLSNNDEFGYKSESDNHEEWCTDSESKTTESYFSPKSLNENEKSQNVLPSQENESNNENTQTTEHSDSKASTSARQRINRNKLTHALIFKKPIFKCKHCYMPFSNAKKRTAHAISAHENRYNFLCNHCNGKYSSLEYLNFHLRRFHKGKTNTDPSCKLMVEMPARRKIIKKEDPTFSNKILKCRHCSEKFLDPTARRNHQITVHGNLFKFQCKHCSKMFVTQAHLHRHLKRIHRGKINPDSTCTLMVKTRRRFGNCDKDKSRVNSDIPPHTGIDKTPIPIFNCKHCSMQFSNSKKRTAHAVSAHESQYNFLCNHCNRKYPSLEYRNFHLRRYHKGKINPDPSCKLMVEIPPRRKIIMKKDPTLSDKTLKCKHCSEKFLDPMVKRDHQITVHENLFKFQCKHCSKKYENQYYLNRHLKNVHKDKINPDPTCTLMVKTKHDTRKTSGNCKKDKSRAKKEKPIRTRTSKTPKTFDCDHCSEQFPDPTLRDAHIINAHENLYSLHCNHCNKTYLTVANRNKHLRIFHNGKINPDPSCTLMLPAPRREIKKSAPVMCEECNYDFKTASRLKNHIAVVHRKERNFICEKCSRSFTSKESLKAHQDFKHGDSETLKSLQCEECGRILGDRQTLRKHIKVVHRKEYQLQCPICNVGYQCQSYLDRHMLNAHSDVSKPHVCNVCQKSYWATNSLKLHMRTHTGERPFKCSFCDKSFTSNYRMTRHEKSLHVEERLFQYEQCGSRFPSQHYLNSHVYSTHNKKKSTIPPKKIVDKQELVKYVESANKSLLERSNTAKGKKNNVGTLRRHMEHHLKQSGLLHNGNCKTENSNEKEPTQTPNLSSEDVEHENANNAML